MDSNTYLTLKAKADAIRDAVGASTVTANAVGTLLGELCTQIRDNSTAIDGGAKQMFIKLWDAMKPYSYNGSAKYNATTGFFEANGLTDITFDQALAIYSAGALPPANSNWYFSKLSNIRTNFCLDSDANQLYHYTFYSSASEPQIIEVAYANHMYGGSATFRICANLKRIVGMGGIGNTFTSDCFEGCSALEQIDGFYFTKAGLSVDLSDCPNINLYTFQQMAQRSTTGGEVIVHTYIMEKMTNESAWQTVASSLANKGINITEK